MSNNYNISDNVVVLNFSAAELPKMREARGGRIVYFGEKNDYPTYLQRLFDTSTKHGSIIAGKVPYIVGNGWAIKDRAEDPVAEAFKNKVNRHEESLDVITKKCSTDIEIFGGFYLQVIWSNLTRRIAEIYHIEYGRVRSNCDNTQFTYRENWASTRRDEEDKVFPAFNPANPRGSQILFYKEYRPGTKTYPLPGYLQGLDWINADVEVARHTHSNSLNGFTPSKSITLVNGEPTDEEKKIITKKYKEAFTGADGKKFILHFTSGADKKPIYDELGASDLTKEDFSQVDGLIQTNVYSAHRITTPALFGISTPGSLGQSTELKQGYEIFKNTYVNDKQRELETVFNRLAKYAGATAKLFIQPTDPIGVQFSEATIKEIAPKAWIYEKLGIDVNDYPADATTEVRQSADEAVVNEHLKNLSGRQMQQLHRIVRQYSTGKITREQATALLKSGLAMSDADIAIWLPIDEPETFSDDEEIMVFAEYGSPRSDFRILKSKKAKFADDMTEASFLAFADSADKLRASILDLISKDKLISNETLADVLKVSIEEVVSIVTSLVESGVIKTSGDERTLTKPLSEAQNGTKPATKTYRVLYSYEGPQDSKNRPFCAKLMQLDRLYSRAEIEKISERLGYSVWDRRGGFYTRPGTNDTTPYCRHTWMANIVTT